MARLKVCLLGTFYATWDGVPLTGFESDKSRALLAYLAVEADRPHRREALAGLLWPDTPERKARTNLRSALANLRQVIHDHLAQPSYLDITRQTLQFNRSSDYWLDVDAFGKEIESLGRQEHSRESGISSTDETRFVKAVDLYRGQFLTGFFISDAPLFEEWALINRESLQRQAMHLMHALTGFYQENGFHQQAIALALRQVELEPFQEAAHQQVMWSLALNGQRNEALLHYEQFKALLETELGVGPLEQTQDIHTRLLDGDVPISLTTNLVLRREPKTIGACPYRGLAAFREADAPFFFGRDEFTNQLLANVCGSPGLAVVVGSSGSGKSSAVFAGLLPQLREDGDWLLIDFRPGKRPYRAMAAALVPHLTPSSSGANRHIETQQLSEALGQGETLLSDILRKLLTKHTSTRRLLLYIDQFEELYTLCPDATLRHRFLGTLLEASETSNTESISPISLLLTLRADFMGQALAYRPFADIMNDNTLFLGPMARRELRAAIEKPAEQQGASFEPGLVTRILDDVSGEPGNLPLLEFAVTQLWEQLDQGWFTHEGYEEIGKVGGALAGYAEDIYQSLQENELEDAQRVIVQLVQPGQGTEDTRRLALRWEFGEGQWDLIQHLADQRLVVTDQDDEGQETVEIIHEALIREWSRINKWMDTNRAFRIWQEQMRIVLHQWEDSGRDEDALLRGVSLSSAESWLIERNDDLSNLERHFIQTSLQKRAERQETEILRQERERALERRSRIFLQVLAAALLIATIISLGLAWFAQNEARQAIEASSLSLAANARQALNDKDYTSALVLALTANQIDEPPLDAQRTLLEAAFSPGPRKLYPVDEIFEGVEGPPVSVAISPDGRTALTGLLDGAIVLWHIASGEEIRRFTGHTPGEYDSTRIAAYSGVNDIEFSPDGTLVVSGGDDGVVILWDANSGKEVIRFKGHSGAVQAVALSPDGRKLISGGLSGDSKREPGELILWDLKTGQEIRRFEGSPEAVIDIGLSTDGNKVIASSGEVDYLTVPGQVYSLIIWDVDSGSMIHQFEGLDRDIPSIAISPDCVDDPETVGESCNDMILAGSSDHSLYLWSLDTGELIRRFEGQADIVTAVAFSPDGRRAISGGGDGELVLWNIERGEPLAYFNAHTASVSDVAFHPDGRSALSVASDGTIVLLDLVNAAQINRFEGHDAAVLDVSFTPNGNHFISASGSPDPAAPLIEEESMRIWNLHSGEQSGSLDWRLSDIFQVAISPDGRRVLSGPMVDQSLRLWDVATGREIRRFEGHGMPILSVAFTPDGLRGLSGAVDSTIILWNLETGQIIRQFTGHEGGIWALAVSPDGLTAISGADDRLLIWWDLETGEEIHRFAGHMETISGVAFSPDGRRAISGDTQGLLIEWDLEAKSEIQRFTGHGGTGPVGRTRVAYLPDGQNAISSGWDGTLALWNLQSGNELYRFRGHDTDFIFDVAISPDGKSALSCGTDKNIIQWQLEIPTLALLMDWIANNRYVRELSCEERELYHIEPLCPSQ